MSKNQRNSQDIAVCDARDDVSTGWHVASTIKKNAFTSKGGKVARCLSAWLPN